MTNAGMGWLLTMGWLLLGLYLLVLLALSAVIAALEAFKSGLQHVAGWLHETHLRTLRR